MITTPNDKGNLILGQPATIPREGIVIQKAHHVKEGDVRISVLTKLNLALETLHIEYEAIIIDLISNKSHSCSHYETFVSVNEPYVVETRLPSEPESDSSIVIY